MLTTGLAADPGVRDHHPGLHHPETPARFDAVLDQFQSRGITARTKALETRLATDDELALAHERAYIDLVRREVAQGQNELSTGDTAISAPSDEVARLAAGAALACVDAVFRKDVSNAFALVRPPGHHATAVRGMGFCLFNSVAVAARYAQRRWQAERVLIVDWDVHHGNGTQDIFYRDGSVLFFSTHQSPWYPGTGDASEMGENSGMGTTINCPLPAGSGATEILGAVQEVLIPRARNFHPDAILISAGFDSRMGDPLGRFTLNDADFFRMTNLLLGLADEVCEGRLISVLEGGYNLQGLASAATSHMEALLGTSSLE